MRRLIVGFSKYSLSAFQARATTICETLGMSPATEYFPNLNPPLSVLVSTTEAFVAFNGADSSKLVRAQRDQVRAQLDDLFKRAAKYLEDTANGDEVMLLATGYELTRDTSTRYEEPLPAPENVRLSWTGFEGQVRMKCKPVKHAKGYQGQYRIPGTNEWITIDPTTKSQRILFNNLIAGQLYEFRVRAFGSYGEGAWSDPQTLRAV